ncbi:MAG: hypothetical protein Q9187_002794, partial [Circinaria calcarea]
MSFLKTRLSQIWRRSEDVEDHNTENRKRSESQSAVSIADSGCFSASSIQITDSDQMSELEMCPSTIDTSAINHHASPPGDSPSKRTLNKVASRTFKMFSDTIRSKTQMFYVTPEGLETPVPTEKDSPEKQKPSIKAPLSLRGRATREARVTDDSGEPPARTLTPTSLPHELNVYIPDASLLEPKPVTTPTKFNSVSSYEDNGYIAEVDTTKVAPSMTSSALVNHETPSCIMLPSTPAGSPRSQVGGSLFVKGNRECIPLAGARSPFRRAILDQKVQTLPINGSQEKKDGNQRQLEVYHRVLVNRTNGVPPALKDLFVSPTEDQATNARFKMQVLPAESYEVDSKVSSEITSLPGMGPKLTWDETRADRQQDFLGSEAMTPETESDTEDDMTLELRPCSTVALPEVLRPEERSRAKSDPMKLPTYKKVRFETSWPTSALKYAIEAIEKSSGDALDAELDEAARVTSALQYAVEAIEKPSGTTMNDEVHEVSSPTGAFTYVFEAVQKPNGPVVDAVMNPGDLNLDSVIRILRKDSKSQEPRMRVVFEDDRSHLPAKDEQSSDSTDMLLPATQTDNSLLKTPSKSEYLIGGSSTHNRSVSAQSAATTDSCAVTTHSKLCYNPLSFPGLHIRTTPVRRTSSINAQVHAGLIYQEDQEVLPKTRQSSRSLSGCSVEVQPPSPTKEKILVEDEFSLDCTPTGNQMETSQPPLLVALPETSTIRQCDLDQKHGLGSPRRSSSMCAPDGDFHLGDTEPDICDSPEPIPPPYYERRLESFVSQGLIPREAIPQVSSLIDRLTPPRLSPSAEVLQTYAVRRNSITKADTLYTTSPETPSISRKASNVEISSVGQTTTASSASPSLSVNRLSQIPLHESDLVTLSTSWFESFRPTNVDEAGTMSPRFSMDILPQMPFDEEDIVPLPTSWFEREAFNDKTSTTGRVAVTSGMSPNLPMDILPQVPFDETDVVPLPISWFERRTSNEKASIVGWDAVANSISPNLPMDISSQMPLKKSDLVTFSTSGFESFRSTNIDEVGSISPGFSMDILPQMPFDEAVTVPFPTSWFESSKPHGIDEFGLPPLSPPLKREERSKQAIKDDFLPLMSTHVQDASNLETEFIAARLPAFGPPRVDHNTIQAAENLQSDHGQITKQVESFPNSDQPTTSPTKAPIGPMGLSPQTFPLAILASEYSRKRSWKMRETSADSEESTYEAVGTLKPVLVTSSVKKGVWWNRHKLPSDGLDSPLGKKAKKQEGSDLLPRGKTPTNFLEDGVRVTEDIMVTKPLVLLEQLPKSEKQSVEEPRKNSDQNMEEPSKGEDQSIEESSKGEDKSMEEPTKGEDQSMEEPTKGEDQTGSVQIHSMFTDDSKFEKEQRSIISTDEETEIPTKEHQVRTDDSKVEQDHRSTGLDDNKILPEQSPVCTDDSKPEEENQSTVLTGDETLPKEISVRMDDSKLEKKHRSTASEDNKTPIKQSP